MTALSPATVTGTFESMFVPLPSSPDWLAPQQRTVPSPSNAHVWLPPAAIEATPLSPAAATGVVEPTVVPVPSCP